MCGSHSQIESLNAECTIKEEDMIVGTVLFRGKVEGQLHGEQLLSVLRAQLSRD